MATKLSQTFSWQGEVGAHFDVRVNGDGAQIGTTFLTYDAGPSTSVNVGDLLASIDFAVTGINFTLAVRSKLPDGTLPSAYSSPIAIHIRGFAVPTGLVIT